jgi:ribulose-bisphosphate carboxylase large chain
VARRAGAGPARRRSYAARRALDQSSRYADLSLAEEDLIRRGDHVLVAYIMKPKAGYDYLATAAHFAAESSTGTNVNVCTTDDFTKTVDALVYYIDPENEEMKIAYPTALFDRNITDGRAMMCSVLTLSIGNNQGMGDVDYGKIYDIYFPPAFLRLFDGPSCCVKDMWRILGRGTSNGGLVVGTIIKPKLGLQPKPFGDACYGLWQGGDFIKNDEPQGNQVFCQMRECIPEVVQAMRQAMQETGAGKLFSANITADDPNEMIARGKYILDQFGPIAENIAFLVDGYVAGGTAVTVARRNFPKQFLHYHRAGHGAVTSPQTQRGYTAFVHTKLSRVIGASGIHTGTMSFGKMEGDASDKNIGFMLQDDVADGPYYRQEWEGMKQTTPIISGGMNALRLPAFFENLGHSNVILTAGGGAFGHKDGPKQGAISCGQGEEAWKLWKAGTYGDVSLSDGVVEYAKTHEEIKGAFLTFQKDADQIYPGWKEKLGYTGESSVQAASFNWQKRSPGSAPSSSASAGSSGGLQKMQDPEAWLKGIDIFIFDCDGVIWRGDSAIPGASATLDKLRAAGKKCFFVTNNSTKSREGYKGKFGSLGLPAAAEEIFSSSFAAAAYLEQTNFKATGKKVYVIGEKGITEELDLIGVPWIGAESHKGVKPYMGSGGKVEVDPNVGAVIVGFDRNINYYKIQYAQLCINEIPGCQFIATNLDKVTHLTDAQEWAGNGSMANAIFGCTGQEPTLVGKPSPLMIEYLESKFGISDRSRICMVGDRLDTDIAFGRNNGLQTCLVLSGVTSEGEVQSPSNPHVPDTYVDDINAFFSLVPA